jgi:hypothetical protein
MEPLPYMYHEIIVLLPDAEITHFQARSTSASSYPHASSFLGVHDAVITAAQLRQHRTPAHQGRPVAPHQHARSYGAPIRCELCLEQFGFSGHDAL